MEDEKLADRDFIASFELLTRRSENEVPTPEKLRSLLVEAEGANPHKVLATAFSVMLLEVVREGYGFPDGSVQIHTIPPHKVKAVDLQAANPSPDASCLVEMYFRLYEPRRGGLLVVAEGDNPFVALNAAYERMLAIVGEQFLLDSVTQIYGEEWGVDDTSNSMTPGPSLPSYEVRAVPDYRLPEEQQSFIEGKIAEIANELGMRVHSDGITYSKQEPYGKYDDIPAGTKFYFKLKKYESYLTLLEYFSYAEGNINGRVIGRRKSC